MGGAKNFQKNFWSAPDFAPIGWIVLCLSILFNFLTSRNTECFQGFGIFFFLYGRYHAELHLKAFFLDFQPVDNQVAPNVALLKNTNIGLG